MSMIEERIAELGLQLPEVVTPLADYVPATRSGHQVFTAGQLPLREGDLVATGKLGDGVSLEAGYACAQQSAMNALAAIKAKVGSLDQILSITKVVVYVASAPSFSAQPAVANGASEVLGKIFSDSLGESARHARSAVGVACLPLDAPVEVELIVTI